MFFSVSSISERPPCIMGKRSNGSLFVCLWVLCFADQHHTTQPALCKGVCVLYVRSACETCARVSAAGEWPTFGSERRLEHGAQEGSRRQTREKRRRETINEDNDNQ